MKTFRFALLLALGAAALAAPASAWPYIDVTASEIVSVTPPRVRTTFEISFAGYNPLMDPGYFEITPLDPANLHIFDCGGPPLWVCGPSFPAGTGGVYFSSYHGSGAPYAPVNTFSIVADQASPCVAIEFAQLPIMEGGYRIDACLLVDAPVPTQPKSWGSVKAVYR
jgi:hypothetical protein